MRKILVAAAFLITSVFADINWAEDIEDAYDIALKDNIKVMVMLSRKECPACEYMKDLVFEDKNFMTFFNENFVGVHVDIHEDFVPEGLEYFATPTFYFLNSNEKVIHRINGAYNVKKFLKKIDEAKLLK